MPGIERGAQVVPGELFLDSLENFLSFDANIHRRVPGTKGFEITGRLGEKVVVMFSKKSSAGRESAPITDCGANTIAERESPARGAGKPGYRTACIV